MFGPVEFIYPKVWLEKMPAVFSHKVLIYKYRYTKLFFIKILLNKQSSQWY